MSAVAEASTDGTQVVVNTKRGWSSFCRDERHDVCTRLSAKCTCSCHGARGQAAAVVSDGTTLTREPPRDISRADAGGASRSFGCPDCPRTFTSKHALAVHEARSHRTKPAAGACPECSRTFGTPQGLGRHRLSVHGVAGATRALKAKPVFGKKAPVEAPPAEAAVEVLPLAALLERPGEWLPVGYVELHIEADRVLARFVAEEVHAAP